MSPPPIGQAGFLGHTILALYIILKVRSRAGARGTGRAWREARIRSVRSKPFMPNGPECVLGRSCEAGLDLALQHRARRAERQLGAELVLPGPLVTAELSAAQLAQLGLHPRGGGGAPGH